MRTQGGAAVSTPARGLGEQPPDETRLSVMGQRLQTSPFLSHDDKATPPGAREATYGDGHRDGNSHVKTLPRFSVCPGAASVGHSYALCPAGLTGSRAGTRAPRL